MDQGTSSGGGVNLRHNLILSSIILISMILAPVVHWAQAQDARDPRAEKVISRKQEAEHPLVKLMAERRASLRPELMGIHPRVYMTDRELGTLRGRARTTHRELWQRVLQGVRALRADPPPPPAQERRAQNAVGIAIAEAAFVYKIEGDKKYLDAAKKYMDAAVSYDMWGYATDKPNVDLAAGHLLYGLGWGYDLLYHDLNEQERAGYRDKLIKQARLLADYYKPKPGRTFAYSQNHVFIPIAGLGVAAYALYGEIPEATEWAKLARAIYDRVLETYSQDGYYYEGFEYWIFSTPWLIHYLDAQAHAVGEDLYERPGLRHMHEYVAHSMLPTGQYVFDFGDVFEGPLTRTARGEDYKRSHPGGHFYTNYNLLYRLAQRFHAGEPQGVGDWLRGFGQVNAEDFWSLAWYDPNLQPVPIERQETWHHFPDHDVLYWRSGWTNGATAFAFKCGPPEGHHTTTLLQRFPDWRLSMGHAHPDANSFIIFVRGEYLTGDSGYAGVPMTEHHNSLLVNGMGQAKEGHGHDAFAGVAYEQLNQIRIEELKVEKNRVIVRGDATAAYEPGLDVKKFRREFNYDPPNGFAIHDLVESARPAISTTLLHADGPISRETANRFRISGSAESLLVDVAAPKEIRTTIETNALIAAGPPGAVDKGQRQERGQKLLISTATPMTVAQFEVLLRVAGTRARALNSSDFTFHPIPDRQPPYRD